MRIEIHCFLNLLAVLVEKAQACLFDQRPYKQTVDTRYMCVYV